MKNYYSEISIVNDLKYLELALQFVDFAAFSIGFSDEDVNRIRLASEEAINNVIEHAFSVNGESSFKIICQKIPTGLEIIIKEKGIPYDPSQLPEYKPGEILKDQAASGLGIHLIKSFMDEFEVKNLGSEGRSSHLIKHLPHSMITDLIDQHEATHFDDEKKKPPRTNVKFTIRDVADKEAIEVSKCIYKTYGYSYLSEHVYYPERIIELNNSGHFITAVAVTDQNEFAGSCALVVEEGAAVASMGQAVVKPEFRNNKCLKYLSEYLISKAVKRNINGLYVEAVANHKFSQMAAQKAGMKDCSILLGYCPVTLTFKKLRNIEDERTSIIQSYLKIIEYAPKNIYVPFHHKDMITKIYANLGIESIFIDPPKNIHLAGSSVIETKFLNNALSATIRIIDTGKDLLPKLETELMNILLKKYEVVFLHVSLEKQENILNIREIEKMGFFFAGVLPNDKGGDSLILQYLNNIEVSISKLSLASDFAQELAGYIQSCKENNPVKQLIDQGESEQLEFKSTLRWNLKTNKKDQIMEIAVMKTIAAFLNSKGGTLLVGVEDSGNILGIEADNFKNEDKFLLHTSAMIKKYIGEECNDFISYELVDVEQKKILQIECKESRNPVFVKDNIKEDFYIRSGPSSIVLNTRKAISYIGEHFE